MGSFDDGLVYNERIYFLRGIDMRNDYYRIFHARWSAYRIRSSEESCFVFTHGRDPVAEVGIELLR